MNSSVGPESAIKPDDYARWHKSRLGALTKSVEQQVIFELSGKVSGSFVVNHQIRIITR